MFEALDLCVECKSCKSECPSSVDMAKIKFEFLARYYEQHPISIRTRLFANIHWINRVCAGGPQAAVVNRLMQSSLSKTMLERWMGISAKRNMPAFARKTFVQWYRERPRQEASRQKNAPGHGRKVVLFHDTFCNYNHPEIGRAATELLEHLGFEVIPSGHRCCGRPMISKGLVQQARKAAQHTTDCLTEFAREGIPVVGLEPSCILSIRDEYPALLPNHPQVGNVARHCFTIEEFLADALTAEQVRPLFTEAPRRVLVHGHCHQRAIAGLDSCLTVLRFPMHYEVSNIGAGCCGMAGAFGYEREHYEISMKMGEDRLFPTIRQADKDTLIAASGTSCREQIQDGTGRKARHPVEILHQAIR
jgi:Fe-S oxidoreductase